MFSNANNNAGNAPANVMYKDNISNVIAKHIKLLEDIAVCNAVSQACRRPDHAISLFRDDQRFVRSARERVIPTLSNDAARPYLLDTSHDEAHQLSPKQKHLYCSLVNLSKSLKSLRDCDHNFDLTIYNWLAQSRSNLDEAEAKIQAEIEAKNCQEDSEYVERMLARAEKYGARGNVELMYECIEASRSKWTARRREMIVKNKQILVNGIEDESATKVNVEEYYKKQIVPLLPKNFRFWDRTTQTSTNSSSSVSNEALADSNGAIVLVNRPPRDSTATTLVQINQSNTTTYPLAKRETRQEASLRSDSSTYRNVASMLLSSLNYFTSLFFRGPYGAVERPLDSPSEERIVLSKNTSSTSSQAQAMSVHLILEGEEAIGKVAAALGVDLLANSRSATNVVDRDNNDGSVLRR